MASRPPYFVKRLEDGTPVNTICRSLKEALDKIVALRANGHIDAWIEDADGNRINEKPQKKT